MEKENRVNLSFTGIASFGRAPTVTNIENITADVAVLGIPFDEGTGFRPGTRFGPRGIRNLSTRFPFFNGKGYWDIQQKKSFLKNVTLVDCGDTDVLYMDPDYTFNQIHNDVKKLLNTGVLPVFLGGDHSITIPIVETFERQMCYIHLDAHLDFRDNVKGVKKAHGSTLRRVSEMSHVTKCVAIGIRGIRHEETDVKDAIKNGINIITTSELRAQGVAESLSVIPSGCDYYVSIDIDILDPSIAPGTGTPEPGGLLYPELKEILKGIAKKGKVLGFDIVEVNPMIDPTEITQLLGGQIVVEFLGEIFAAD